MGDPQHGYDHILIRGVSCNVAAPLNGSLTYRAYFHHVLAESDSLEPFPQITVLVDVRVL